MPRNLGRVLVVEDDPDLVAVLEYALRRAGAEDVVVARDGFAALSLARRKNPDLILLDLMIPGVDGLEVARHLRAGPPVVTAPIVFITAATSAFRDRTPEECGAIGLLPKPFDAATVARDLLRLLERHAGG
ncbi:MAG: response regulator [Myxococcota bacterium]